MAGSRAGRANKRTLEYVQLYEKLRRQYGCPVETLFAIASGHVSSPKQLEDGTWDESGIWEPVAADMRLRAAGLLVKQRFPQVKAVEINARTGEAIDQDTTGQLILAWATEDDGVDDAA